MDSSSRWGKKSTKRYHSRISISSGHKTWVRAMIRDWGDHLREKKPRQTNTWNSKSKTQRVCSSTSRENTSKGMADSMPCGCQAALSLTKQWGVTHLGMTAEHDVREGKKTMLGASPATSRIISPNLCDDSESWKKPRLEEHRAAQHQLHTEVDEEGGKKLEAHLCGSWG